MTVHSYERNCQLRTSSDTIRFMLRSPSGRFNDGRSLTHTIDLINRKVSAQDDGTGASKIVSRVINATLKHQGWLTIKKIEGHAHLHYFKIGNVTYCNAHPIKSYMTGPILLGLITNMHTKSQEDIDSYVEKCRDSVPEVLACLTNNLKYRYFHEGSRETSLLKIDVISDKEMAIQLYEGCWIPMKQTTFRSLYSAGNQRINKFTFISPEELYFICTGEHLTDVQIKLMYAYLMQNTSEKLVTERSLALLDELPEMFPTRVKKLVVENNRNSEKYTQVMMMVKGNALDWAIFGNITGNNQTGRQSVNSHMCISLKNYFLSITNPDGTSTNEKIKGYSTIKEHVKADTSFILIPMDSTENLGSVRRLTSTYYCEESDEIFYLGGSICIDQQNTDVSIGDQFASRALAFLNDTASFDRVSTMRGYKKNKVVHRVDINAMSKLQGYTEPYE